MTSVSEPTVIVVTYERSCMEKIPHKSYKVSEVAERLGCTPDHVYRMVKYGNIEAFRVGGKANIRIPDYAIDDFIERMQVRSKALKDG